MNKQTIANWAILLILSIVWGSSFILMKKSLISFSYLEVGFFRLIIAFIILSPFVISTILRLKKKHIIPLLIVSLIGTVFPAILFAKSQMYLNSTTAGMLNSLTPIFTLIIGLVWFQHKTWSSKNIIGILLGLIGTYILLFPESENTINTKYSLMIILSTIFYAISINTIKEKLGSLNPLDIAVASSLFSVFIPCFYVYNMGVINTLEKIYINISTFYYLIILGTFCTSLAIILFNYLIKRSNALFASSTTYLIPVFALIWGVLDAEIIGKNEIIGIIIILVGTFIMNHKKLEY